MSQVISLWHDRYNHVNVSKVVVMVVYVINHVVVVGLVDDHYRWVFNHYYLAR